MRRMPPRRSDSVAVCLLRSLIRQETELLAPACLTSGAQHLPALALCLLWAELIHTGLEADLPLSPYRDPCLGLAEGNIVKLAQGALGDIVK